MKRTVSAGDARKRLGELLEQVYHRGDEVVIERAGRPMGVVISMDRYRALESQREELFRLIEEIQEANRNADPDEVEREITEAMQAVRPGYRPAE